MTFCTDTDLLHWEPSLLADAAFASQSRIAGTGSLSGSTFTISSGSFLSANVQPRDVIILSGAIAGCFPIASVDSATQLALSVLYDQLFANESPAPSPIGTATGLNYIIRTFWPQRKIVSDLLLHTAQIDPEDSSLTIVNPDALRRPCSLGTLQLIYSALAAAAEEPSDLQVRADLYERLYRRSLRRVRIEIETPRGRCVRDLGAIKCVRR